MMCTTVLHGGVCHRTSTPHKSGNKMKEKKKKILSENVTIIVIILRPQNAEKCRHDHKHP